MVGADIHTMIVGADIHTMIVGYQLYIPSIPSYIFLFNF
jgi:hypothetical protein